MESQTLTNNSIKEQEKETKYGAILKTSTEGLIAKSSSLLQTLFAYTTLVFVFIVVLVVNLEFKEKLKSLASSLEPAIEDLEERAFQELQKICSSLARDFRRVSFYVTAAGLSSCRGVRFCLKYVREIIAEIPDEEDDKGGEEEEEDRKEHEEKQ